MSTLDSPFFTSYYSLRCSTCHLTYFTCPGHYGHIELPLPVFHPLFFQSMYKVMKGMCTYCHRFKMTRLRVRIYLFSDSQLLNNSIIAFEIYREA